MGFETAQVFAEKLEDLMSEQELRQELASLKFETTYSKKVSKSFDFPARRTPVITLISGVPITSIKSFK